jgi:hypothetical protein
LRERRGEGHAATTPAHSSDPKRTQRAVPISIEHIITLDARIRAAPK